MNFDLPQLPERTQKPRMAGLTMSLDKGYSLRQAEDFMAVCSSHVDFVKFGWSTSYVTPGIREKIALYKQHDVQVYLGGTLFEAFVARGAFDAYLKLLDELELTYAEVSDGSLELPQKEKLKYIKALAARGKVFSEVGSKDSQKVYSAAQWLGFIRKELDAGSECVITEARESGNVGMFRATGEVRSGLVEKILEEISAEKLLFEAPQKAQQVWFIKLLGSNVNLGNIAPSDVVGLETLRLGLRGDTFHHFLDHPYKPQ